MNGQRESWIRTAGAVLLLVLAAAVVWHFRGLVVTLLFALVGAYVLRPLVHGLCRPSLSVGGRACRLSRGLATGVVFLALVALLWLIWQLSAPSLGRQIDELQARWPRWGAQIGRLVENADRYYRERLPPALRPTLDSWIKELPGPLTGAAKKGLGLTVHGVGALVELLLVPILVFYFLADGPGIRRQVLFFVPERYLERTELTLDQADDVFQRYIKGQVILCLIAFAVVTVGLYAIDVDFYLLLGMIAGITRAIPIIGPVVGAVPILVVVFLTKTPALSVWVLVLFTLMHLLESKLLMPAILGQQLDLHPVLIIVALLIGAQMGGFLGLFLAAPVLAVIKTVVAERRRLRPEAG
jgi:predicted PurR-regulated permease PerM